MILASRTPLEGYLIGSQQTSRFGSTIEQANQANKAFDAAFKQFLRDWIRQDLIPLLPDEASGLEEFIEQGALRSFFNHHPDAIPQLLDQETIAHHLLRPVSEVYFDPDAYEPLLARYERRIYNLAARHLQLDVSFRYNPPSRHDSNGDPIDFSTMPADQIREDIGMYFGTRRSDETALTILARWLRQDAQLPSCLPIHVITEGYMEDSLRMIKVATEQLGELGNRQLHCFLIQRRHAADDRHLGAALLLMNPLEPNQPQRVIFCDTLNPNGKPPWWDKFRYKLDTVFPQPAGNAPISDRLEDGGVNLQRLHDGVAVRHQDIDCAFYTYSMVQALIGVTQSTPQVIMHAPIDEVVSHMTAGMPKYFAQANQPKDPVIVREENVIRRWNTGRIAVQNLKREPALEETPLQKVVYEMSYQSEVEYTTVLQ